MAHNKKQSLEEPNIESPFLEEFLERLPMGLRFMVRTETESIGELYRRVKFSQSGLHQSKQYTNYAPFKPLSNILLRNEDPEISHGDE